MARREWLRDPGNYRLILILGVVVVILGLAGCNGTGGAETPEPITASASPGTVSDDALTTAGYEEDSVEERGLTASGRLDISGDVQMELRYTIQATTSRAIYRDEEASPPQLFSVMSVPLAKPEQVSATINPLRDRSLSDLANRSQDTYSGITDLRHSENITVSVLGNETTLSKYSATATTDGDQTDVYLYVVRFRHEDDILIGIGLGPQSADVSATIRTLAEAIQH